MKDLRAKLALLFLFFGMALFFISFTSYSSTIREVVTDSEKLIPIHTSLGFSTILEFQEKPISAILGDQDAFKLEYVGNSITLKPLVQGARTNLFVYTSFERFNFSIATSPPPNTDYVVRIGRESKEKNKVKPISKLSPYVTVSVNQKSERLGLELKVIEIDLSRDSLDPRSASLIKFLLTSKKEKKKISSSSFGLKQDGKFLDVEGIYLDRIEVEPNSTLTGVFALLNQQWKRQKPLTLVFAFEQEQKKKTKTERIFITFLGQPKIPKKENSSGQKELFPVKAR